MPLGSVHGRLFHLQSNRKKCGKTAQGAADQKKDFIAKLQVLGLDINPTSYSKLERQLRNATDKEVYAIACVLGVPLEALFDEQ